MSIANQHAAILTSGFVIAIVVAAIAGDVVATPIAIALFLLLAAVNVTVVRTWSWRWIWRWENRRLLRLFAAEDVAGALELTDRLSAQATTKQVREVYVCDRGIAMLMDEQWKSGLAVLRALDRTLLNKATLLLVDNSIAWALIHDGALEEGLALARTTVDAARVERTLDPYSRGACIGTLGSALVLANMPQPGLALLREALALVAPPHTQTKRLLYMGDAEHALGHDAEARAAWGQAVKLAPDSRFGRRAAERLKSAPPLPYR